MSLPDPTVQPTVSVAQACELLGISSWKGYGLIRADQFPVHVLRLGKRLIRVPTRPLLEVLGLDELRRDEDRAMIPGPRLHVIPTVAAAKQRRCHGTG